MCLISYTLLLSVWHYIVKSVYAGHSALHSVGTGLILTLLHSLPVYSHMIRLSACLHYQAHGRLFLHYQVVCLSILSLSDSLTTHSHTIRLTAIYSHSIRLAAYVFHTLSGSLPMYYQACCTHYQARCLCTIRLAAYVFHTLSGSLPMYYQACCLCISHTIRLAAIYSHSIRLTLYLLSHSCYCLSVLTPNGGLQ